MASPGGQSPVQLSLVLREALGNRHQHGCTGLMVLESRLVAGNAKSSSGLGVRIALADPDGEEVAARDRLEGLGGTLPGRIRSTVTHLEPLLASHGVEIRFHGVPLYNAIYRFDDEMLVTPYLYRLHGYQHPLLHLKRLGPAGIFESYAEQFEAIWTESHPIFSTSGGPRDDAS